MTATCNGIELSLNELVLASRPHYRGHPYAVSKLRKTFGDSAPGVRSSQCALEQSTPTRDESQVPPGKNISRP